MAAEAPDQIPAHLRRFDSLAWLIHGDNTCAACCFYQGTLLMAFNFDLRMGKGLFRAIFMIGDMINKETGKCFLTLSKDT